MAPVAPSGPPAEALKLEDSIAKKKVKLSSLKPRTIEELETSDKLISTYEGKPPHTPKDLIKEEMEAIEGNRTDLNLQIKDE